jgi:hypothetical protein
MTTKVPFKLSTPAASGLVIPSVLSTVILALVATAMLLGGSSVSWAQTLQLGSTTFTGPNSCPQGANKSMPLANATCYTATVTGCYQQGVAIPDLAATVAVSTPPGYSQGKPGTIFLHGGGSGQDYFGVEGTSPGYAAAYYNANFQVVQIAWMGNWAANTSVATNALKYVACRPATLLHDVYARFQGSNGAMCAQGHSAGSGAMAYALAWYNAQSYLNDVVLTSGPVFADIEAGCQYPATLFPSPVVVCPTGQHGCIGKQWSDPVQYLNNDGDNGTGLHSTAWGVATATNNSSPGNCNNWMNMSTVNTSGYDQNWHTMSVTASGASYNYPHTSLYAFLCATGQSQNNSAAEGQLFYQNFKSSSQTLNYNVYRVNNCDGDEEIWGANAKIPNGTSAYTASSQSAMIQGCVKPASPQDQDAQADKDISQP